MKYQQEVIDWVRDEIEPLLKAHYKEVAKHQDKVKYDPNWGFYYAAEKAGMFYVFTARTDEGVLVGYNCYFINPHPHYRDSLCAMNDIFYVTQAHRGRMTGLRLLDFSEKALYNGRGIKWFLMHVKDSHDFSPMLVRTGYKLHEHIYSKILE